MNTTLERLNAHTSNTPSQWREEAAFRQKNKSWLRYSQMIATAMLDQMEKLGFTQKMLAERMGCSQQYVSKILRGKENLSLETLCKIEEALNLQIVYEAEVAV